MTKKEKGIANEFKAPVAKYNITQLTYSLTHSKKKTERKQLRYSRTWGEWQGDQTKVSFVVWNQGVIEIGKA